MWVQERLPLRGGWRHTKKYVPFPFPGPRFHPHSLAPEEVTEGGSFDYAAADSIFLGRTGWGPLRVAWDTNILIDWRDFGEILWSDNALPDDLEPGYEEDLLALGAIMFSVWVVRDIRIRCFRRQRDDFRRGADAARLNPRRANRDRTLGEISAAVKCTSLDEPGDELCRLTPEWEARFMRPSFDRDLVEQAIVSGCHVFLTRDQGVLRHAEPLQGLGLLVTTPSRVLNDLLEAAQSSSTGIGGMACDSHKWHHLAMATPVDD